MMLQQSDNTHEVNRAVIAFDTLLQQALRDKHRSLKDRMSRLLKPIADLCGAYTVVVRLYDKALDRQYIVARHCPAYADLLDNIGARKVRTVVKRFLRQRRETYYRVANIQEQQDFQADLVAVKKKYNKETKEIYRERYKRYIEYLEQLGATLIVKFGLHDEEDFTVMLFVGKRIGDEDWRDHEFQFILDRVPALEMFLRTVYESERRRGIQAVQNSLDLQMLHRKELVYSQLLKAACDLTKGDLVLLRSYDKITKKLRLISYYPPNFPIAVPTIIKEGFGVTGVSASSGLPCFIANTERDRHYRKTLKHARAEMEAGLTDAEAYYHLVRWTKSGIALPLMITDVEGRTDINGVLAVISGTVNHFSPFDVLAMQSFAKEAAYFLQASETLTNMRRYAEMASHDIGNLADNIDSVLGPLRDAHKQRESVNFILGEVLDKYEACRRKAGEMEARLASYALALPPVARKGKIHIVIAQAIRSSAFFIETPPFSSDPHFQLPERLMTRTLRFLPDPDIPDVDFDPIQLKAAFGELLENAALWGATTVDIFTSYNRTKRAIELVIEDNGRGIPSEHASIIFSPLVTLRKAGTGLGLALVRQTMESHGGTAELYVLANERDLPRLPARFLLTLPVRDE